jgi:hypothetical protein
LPAGSARVAEDDDAVVDDELAIVAVAPVLDDVLDALGAVGVADEPVELGGVLELEGVEVELDGLGLPLEWCELEFGF